MIEDILRRERAVRPASQPWFWRTQAGAEVDFVLERGDLRVAVEVKAGRGGEAYALRSLREAVQDIAADRTWIVDQAPGTQLLAPGIARVGFAEAIDGTP